jgi:hypothetical protein
MEIGEGLLRLLTSLADDTCVLVLEGLHCADSETAAVLKIRGRQHCSHPGAVCGDESARWR